MTRFFVLAGYFYQSLAAIALIFAVGHLLESSSYTAFSLAAAFSQLICVLAFEWLQVSGTRFLSGAQPEARLSLRAALYLSFVVSSLALLALSPLALAFSSIAGRVALLAIVLAVAQGLADLLFTIIRVEGRPSLAAGLLVFRSTTLVVAAVAGAWLERSTDAVLVGMLAGQTLGVVAALTCDRGLLTFSHRLVKRSDLVAFIRYGMVAALASVIFMTVNVMTRFLIVGRLGTSSVAAAGFSMAFDLLQRPFSVLVAALHMAAYPQVVALYDRGSQAQARQAAVRLFEQYVSSTLILLAGLGVFLPDIAWFFVPARLLDGFLAVAPAVCTFAFVNIHLQVSAAMAPHLTKQVRRLVVVAAGQLAGLAVLVSAILACGGSPALALFAAAALSAAWGGVASGSSYRFGISPRPGPMLPPVLGSTVIAALAWLPATSPGWLAGKVAIAAFVTCVIAWQGEFLRARSPPRS